MNLSDTLVQSALRAIAKHFSISRPLVSLDYETTGVNAQNDRIIQVGIHRVAPDGYLDSFGTLVNPGMPIPAGATAVHGITDEDVAGAPHFRDICERMQLYTADADFIAYNGRFDLDFTEEEYRRCGVNWSWRTARVLDAEKIFKFREPRTLSAALAFYLNLPAPEAHDALADAGASALVLAAQLKLYTDLPTSLDDLSDFCYPRDPDAIDARGKLKWIDGVACVTFGKHGIPKPTPLAQLPKDYLRFMALRADGLPADVKQIFVDAHYGKFPTREKSA